LVGRDGLELLHLDERGEQVADLVGAVGETGGELLGEAVEWVAVGGEEEVKKGDRGYMSQMFDTATQKVTAKLKSHEGQISSLAFVLDPKLGAKWPRLVSGSYDHTVMVWDPEIGQELLSLPLSDRNSDRVQHLFVSPNGLRIAATDGMTEMGLGGKIVRVWSATPPPQRPATDEDAFALTPVERDPTVR